MLSKTLGRESLLEETDDVTAQKSRILIAYMGVKIQLLSPRIRKMTAWC